MSMPRFFVQVDDQTFNDLAQIAIQERRAPRDQAAILLTRAISDAKRGVSSSARDIGEEMALSA